MHIHGGANNPFLENRQNNVPTDYNHVDNFYGHSLDSPSDLGS